MSVENVKAFYKKVEGDEKLQGKLKAIVEGPGAAQVKQAKK